MASNINNNSCTDLYFYLSQLFLFTAFDLSVSFPQIKMKAGFSRDMALCRIVIAQEAILFYGCFFS